MPMIATTIISSISVKPCCMRFIRISFKYRRGGAADGYVCKGHARPGSAKKITKFRVIDDSR
jgi:hypothetical protein